MAKNLNTETNDMFITSHLGAEQLPGLVQSCLHVATSTPMKDMLLLSVLTNCAYALPAMRCYHGQPRHAYGPDLMTMVLAPAASGKGVMNYGRKLMRAIEGERGKQVYIPANASSSALIALMQRFNGRGIMMATEMDTLSQTLRSSYGQFSDVIRCLFEHETIAQLRRQNNEFIEIRDPHVSLLLSGTFNQLTPLLKSRENGLMSRFLCYVVTERADFMDEVWDSDNANENYDDWNRVAEQVGALYLQQVNSDHPCWFSFTDAQRQQVKRMFRAEYDNYATVYGAEFDQTLKRMPVIMKRLGMVLTGLRLDPNQPLPERVACCDADFRTIMLLGHKLLMHAATTYDLLPTVSTPAPVAPSGSIMQKQFLDSLPERFSWTQVQELAATTGTSIKTVGHWITNNVQSGNIERVKHGEYRKVG
ncbi:MAG: DUF3987 domain-containing protein [Paludibacteraceae bacterium]|nr:DUF3987 domain-containing protein [Paludibacteraceae bacterium]